METAVVLETSGPAGRDVGQAGKVGQQGVLGARAVVEAPARWGRWHGTAGDGSEEEEEEEEEGRSASVGGHFRQIFKFFKTLF